ncbi:MAG: hypothetical protein LC105_04170 [Chitinophagales bacterium]|nr:hypothetical protein [Chitinophagales bacterium]
MVKRMSEDDWKKLHQDYFYWIVDLNDPGDPPDYEKAADVLLSWLQEYCTHPMRLYGYQLSSITNLVRQLHCVNGLGVADLMSFQKFCLSLLNTCNQGQLPDTRIQDN